MTLAEKIAFYRPDWVITSRHLPYSEEELEDFSGYDVVAQASSGAQQLYTAILRRRRGD
jgi:hypothetical protein